MHGERLERRYRPGISLLYHVFKYRANIVVKAVQPALAPRYARLELRQVDRLQRIGVAPRTLHCLGARAFLSIGDLASPEN